MTGVSQRFQRIYEQNSFLFRGMPAYGLSR